MKHHQTLGGALVRGFIMVIAAFTFGIVPNPALASGGSGLGSGSVGGGSATTATKTDVIKVNKCYYANVGAYVELLLNAVSSDSSAHLYAYLPDGTYLGEVQNGGGGRYGGTVFVTLYIPKSITFISSSGGRTTVPTVSFQF